jgi:hypothetical protein
MSEAHDTLSEKVRAIFTDAFGGGADQLRGDKPAFAGLNALQKALTDEFGLQVADEIAFHLAECNWNSAFIVAVCLFPERFTDEELLVGAKLVLSDAPDHLAAAAKLSGNPVKDVFQIGVADESSKDLTNRSSQPLPGE